jgi:hypothetical protein
MDTLERQNRELTSQIESLRRQLQSSGPAGDAAPLDERMAVTESRVEEQAQSKVEASQKLPVTISGQLLFNAFSNTGHTGPLPDSVYSPLMAPSGSTGATVRQTMIGLDFNGPSLPLDGKVNAHIMLDFFSGIPSEQFDWIRMRTSDISFDWEKRSIAVAFDKPLISPRQPNSLAEVSIPALADSGNLWLWVPQVRYEERVKLGNSAGLKAQAALLQTDETYNYVPAAFSASLEQSRPAAEGRAGLWKKWGEAHRLEVAGGFHASTSHVAHSSADSRIYSLDWLARPFSKLEITGTYFRGQNFAALGALSSGFSITSAGLVTPVHGQGGWTQFSVPLTSRLTLNLFGGLQNNRAVDISDGNVIHNFTYAGNFMFHVTQNVVVSLEALRMQSRLRQDADLIRNRYDLAVAYLF